MNRTQASCAWGDGPDVLIVIPPGTKWGIVKHSNDDVSFGFDVHDAKMLVNDLLAAIEECERFEKGLEELAR